MEIITRVARMREISRALRSAGRRLGFVPTMGALHEGHVSLVRAAREACDVVVLSAFVNPIQFGPAEDFERYPRRLAEDAELAAREGVEFVFAPSPAEMYPPGYATHVDVEGLSGTMCGASRPGHFRGVATVVLKLFEIVSPDLAVFGAKDYQQAAIVRRMALDLNLPVEILVAPTIREADGLAMSSRNAFLAPPERRAATVLRRGLDQAERLYAAGERDTAGIEAAVRKVLDGEPLARTDYVAVVDAETLKPAARLADRTLVAMAVWIGNTRLIDNCVLE